MSQSRFRRALALALAFVIAAATAGVAFGQEAATPTGNFGGGAIALPVKETSVARDMLLSIRARSGGRLGVDGQIYARCGLATISGDVKLDAAGQFTLRGESDPPAARRHPQHVDLRRQGHADARRRRGHGDRQAAGAHEGPRDAHLHERDGQLEGAPPGRRGGRGARAGRGHAVRHDLAGRPARQAGDRPARGQRRAADRARARSATARSAIAAGSSSPTT